jgi:hypothetical protein
MTALARKKCNCKKSWWSHLRHVGKEWFKNLVLPQNLMEVGNIVATSMIVVCATKHKKVIGEPISQGMNRGALLSFHPL